MRFYSITNMYLSDIQKGIQTAHVISECSQTENELYKVWATDHKTIIVLNGGYTSNIKRIAVLIENSTLDGVSFKESEEALDGAMTATGLVVPERFYILGDYSKQGIVDSTKLETIPESTDVDSEPLPAMYRMSVSEKIETDDETKLKLQEQIDSFGDYTEADVILINELGNLRLA